MVHQLTWSHYQEIIVLKDYNDGKLLSEAGTKYGEGIIKEYSKRLSKELSGLLLGIYLI